MKYSVLRAIEDTKTLQQFLQLDQQPKEMQESFLKLEEALHNPDNDSSIIAQGFLSILDAKGDIGQYAFIRAIKANRIELAADMVAKNPLVISSNSFEQISTRTRCRIADNLVQKGHLEQAVEVIKTVTTLELAIFEAIKENQQALFEAVLPTVIDQGRLGRALDLTTSENHPEMFEQLVLKVTDQESLGRALWWAVEMGEQEMFEQLVLKVTDPELLGNAFVSTVPYNRPEMFEQLVLKVTDPELLGNAFVSTVRYNRPEMFEQLVLKVTDQNLLWQALQWTVSNNKQEMFELLLPKVTDQNSLGKALVSTVRYNLPEMFEQLLPKVTDQNSLGEALVRTTVRYRPEMFERLLPTVTDQKQLKIALLKVITHDNYVALEAILPRIIDRDVLNEALYQSTRRGARSQIAARIDELRAQTMQPQATINIMAQAVKRVNEFLKQYDPLKILDGVAAAEITGAQRNIAQHGQQSILPPTALVNKASQADVATPDIAPAGINMPSIQVRDIAENASSQIALVGVVGHMIGNAAKSFYSFFNNETATHSSSINREAKDIDKKLLSLEGQFRALHDKRVTEYTKFPSKSLAEEINHLKSLQDKATLTLERLENFNKLDKDGNKEDLQRKANNIWKSYKKLKEAQKVINVKRIAAVRDVLEGLKGAGVEQSERVSVANPINIAKTQDRIR